MSVVGVKKFGWCYCSSAGGREVFFFFFSVRAAEGLSSHRENSERQGGNDEMKFGHDVLDRKPQICICSGECETVLPPACARAHPARSISAHLARSIRINCISARERARWIEGEGERFSPSVGLVLLQGESFKILPPMWLLVFTLMTPLLSTLLFTP